MHAIQAGHALPGQQRGHSLVGRDHEMLDQAVRLGLCARPDLADVPVGVEQELRLERVDHECPAPLAAALQRRGRLARRYQRCPPGLCGGLVPGEDAIHALVIEPLVRAYERAVERCARHGVGLHVELHRHGQALRPWQQRAGVIAKCGRQHGLDGPRQIDARRSPARLAVERRAFGHVRCHVGDVNPHPH